MTTPPSPQDLDLLYAPLTIGKLDLPNRLVMSPMTRSRTVGGLVTSLHTEYYAQRAGAGLIISESTHPNVVGQGYIQTPGIHSPEQVAAWRTVTDAVHAAGGRIFIQLTHCGRIGHPALYPDGELPVAPSAVASGEQLFTGTEMVDHPVPRGMTASDITGTIADFAAAATHAIEAGFDGVELHGANGFLLHQFLADNTNRRNDRYGGPVHNRIQFVIEVVDAVAATVGPERTALKISPGNPFNGIIEQDPAALYRALTAELATRDLAYIHVSETGDRAPTEVIRTAWPGTLILNPHPVPDAFPATPAAAGAALASGVADAVSLATLWLANPDLDLRIKAGGPYNDADPATFYGGDHRGYTDYPTLVSVTAAR
ncbi:MAG: alkene reductase [Acidimicrobiales bacterium]